MSGCMVNPSWVPVALCWEPLAFQGLVSQPPAHLARLAFHLMEYFRFLLWCGCLPVCVCEFGVDVRGVCVWKVYFIFQFPTVACFFSINAQVYIIRLLVINVYTQTQGVEMSVSKPMKMRLSHGILSFVLFISSHLAVTTYTPIRPHIQTYTNTLPLLAVRRLHFFRDNRVRDPNQ